MPLRSRIKEIAQTRVRYGLWRIYILLRREGWKDNHKRVYRVYKEEGLNLRSKRPRRSQSSATRLDRPENLQLYQCWSMDFVSDALFDGRKFRTLTVVDNYSRECLFIKVGQSLKGVDVVETLEYLSREKGLVPHRPQPEKFNFEYLADFKWAPHHVLIQATERNVDTKGHGWHLSHGIDYSLGNYLKEID